MGHKGMTSKGEFIDELTRLECIQWNLLAGVHAE